MTATQYAKNPLDSDELHRLKVLGREFFDLLPNTKTVEQVENGIKCFGIAYVNFHPKDDKENHIAIILWELVNKKGNARVLDLLFGSR